tara:strand:- start:3408 stop:3554 length:147 start_codon:yes stop_codon:yes gene_type:complete
MSTRISIRRGFTLLGCFSGLASHLIKRYSFTTELLALRQEAFAGVSFH